MQKESGALSSGDSTVQLLNERGKTHGDFTLHAAVTQAIKNLYNAPFQVGTDCHSTNWNRLNTVQREALEMIAHKIGRILAGNPNFKDHWDDIAGYAKLVADRCHNA